MKFWKTAVILLLFTVSSLLLGFAAGDDAKDKQDCTNSLVGLATCLPYVGGNTKSPTPDCCNGLKQVLKDDKKCLCLIIKDRNDPQIGININVTLALGLPAVCQAPANISNCPELLHLDPKSPDAQLFYQYGHDDSSSIANTPASSPTATVVSTSPTSSPSPGSSAQQKNDGCRNGMPWFMKIEAISILVSFYGLSFI